MAPLRKDPGAEESALNPGNRGTPVQPAVRVGDSFKLDVRSGLKLDVFFLMEVLSRQEAGLRRVKSRGCTAPIAGSDP